MTHVNTRNLGIEQKTLFSYLVFVLFSLLSTAILENSRGPLYPLIIEQLELTPTMASLIFIIAPFASIMTNLVRHRFFSGKGSALSSLMAACFTIFIGQLFFALAFYPMLKNYSSFLLYSYSLLLGIGLSLGFVANNTTTAAAVGQKYQKMALSTLHSLYSLSSFFAPLLFALSITYKIPLYLYLFLLSTFPLLLFLFGLKIFFFHSTKESQANRDEFKRREQLMSVSHEVFDKAFSYFKNLYEIKQRKHHYLICGALGFFVLAEILVTTRLVYFLVEGMKQPLEQANQFLSLFFLTMFITRVGVGAFKLKNLYYYVVLFFILTFLFILLGLSVHPLFLALSGGIIGPVFPMAITWLLKIYPKYFNRLMIFLNIAIALLGIVGNFAMGPLTEAFTISHSLYLALFSVFISIILLLAGPKKWRTV